MFINIIIYHQKPSKIQGGRALFFKSDSLIFYSSTESGVIQYGFKNDPISSHASGSYIIMLTVRVRQNLKMKRNVIEIVVPCFFFHKKLFKTL